ncbi:MAG TPA: ATP-dependent RNA helicase HrpA [Paenalcaligenes sp.]|nr:ATP-dependent RNA helicase HrpA [Paenalcaligenes sp.]
MNFMRSLAQQTTTEHTLPFKITYPEDLPVSARRDDIAKAIQEHQVVIISGETGSGKTTQIPKICLELGRGHDKTIGHTQPRRIAATSVAHRIAEELETPIGRWVGYQIRFADKSTDETAIKLMTDGILLAESQRDPLLRQYDTIIIDEAHERTLNIDFLLGFLYQLLQKRPDLKLIITSATIDADKFAQHFSLNGQPAPVIDVSGRLHPVEIRYRSILQDDDGPDTHGQGSKSAAEQAERDLHDGILDAVQECRTQGSGDILVFLPGEREIRDAARFLRRQELVGVDILPLYARLNQAEQQRIFRPQGQARRVVLATNVAETSVTVPGIRYVVDSGLARIKRYSWRNKIEQLRIERISQASANQRAGRCGRLGPGVCIRLYSEEDFESRSEFTDPEILRSSLASVILRLKSLRVDDVENFPFVDPPSGRAIADGYQILEEVGALNARGRLTRVGRTLSRWPLDPRIGRMIIAAQRFDCLSEVLVIAAALSVQDPRDRSMERREQAERAHQRFINPQSEFLSYLNMWQWYSELVKSRLSRRALAQRLREQLLSPMRFREWREVYKQLSTLVREQKWRINQSEATYEQIHKALLTGLLSQIGYRTEDGRLYQGTREIRFYIHPGSTLSKRGGAWVLAGEIVQTTQVFARCVARIEPEWIESVAGRFIRKHWNEPRWEKRNGRVVANERGMLFGLLIYQGRRVHFGRINPVEAREIFLREGLVPAEMHTQLDFYRHNQRLIRDIEQLEHRSRRPDILVDEQVIYEFYDKQIPDDVYQTATLERWYRKLPRQKQKQLYLTREVLMQHKAQDVTVDVYPRVLDLHGLDLKLSYHFEPGSIRDGVTLHVPLFHLNQLTPEPLQWLVPGLLKDKVEALLRSLPLRHRRVCVPIPDYVEGFYERHFKQAVHPSRSLIEALIQDIWQQKRVRIDATDFKIADLPAHLHMNIHVVDDKGRFLAGGRDLHELQTQFSRKAQQQFREVASQDQRVEGRFGDERFTDWSFGDWQTEITLQKGRQSVTGYPALEDQGKDCQIVVLDDSAKAQRVHQQGLKRLFLLQMKESERFQRRELQRDLLPQALQFRHFGTQDELVDQVIERAIEQVALQQPWPTTEKEFRGRLQQAKQEFNTACQEMVKLITEILKYWTQVQQALQEHKAYEEAYADMQAHLRRLMPKGFLKQTGYEQLRHFPRYLRGVLMRMDKLRTDPNRDQRWQAEITPLELNYLEARKNLKGAVPELLQEYRWQLEELRVSLFAQELRTPRPVSAKRLNRLWERVRKELA